jgi:hypothetical protein
MPDTMDPLPASLFRRLTARYTGVTLLPLPTTGSSILIKRKNPQKNAKTKTATRRPSHISERVYLHYEQPSSPRLARYILHMHRKPPPVAFAYPHQRHSKATHRYTSRDYPQSHSNKLSSSRIFISSSPCILRTQIFA